MCNQRICVDTAIAQSSCSPTNVTCICTDQHLTDTAYACVRSSCSIRDSLSNCSTVSIFRLRGGVLTLTRH